MISVSEALDALFSLTRATDIIDVPLIEAAGHVLARPMVAERDQPPFDASAMDGYALRSEEAQPGATFNVIGEAAAGHRFEGTIGPGQCARIFTGGVVPDGADRVVLQEDTNRNGNQITLGPNIGSAAHIRPAGGDFRIGDRFDPRRRLSPEDIARLAAMNISRVPVHRPPVVALISTGDELVMPGDIPGPDQIIASNTFGLHALLKRLGAQPRLLPIARDTREALDLAFDLATGADLIVTIGGASVGDHDIVAQAMAGMDRRFYKVAMRPGKPLMSGRWNDMMMLGLPGNPVSAMVCGHVFLAPVINAMSGLPAKPAPRRTAPLAVDLPVGGPREHYMRAALTPKGITPFERQDSALLSVLSDAHGLMIRPPNDAPRKTGEVMEYLPL